MVTEVTIYRDLRCVAGLELETGRMIRPEPEPGGFWPALLCGENTTFHPGHLVNFHGEAPPTEYPHRTEDIVVRGDPWREAKLTDEQFREHLAKSIVHSPQAVFGQHLEFDNDKAFVRRGAICGSLACIEIGRHDLHLLDATYKGKHTLRASLAVMGVPLQLSVAAKNFKQAHFRDGFQAAKNLLAGAQRYHVRLGLARAWPEHPEQCYLQINGIHPI